LLLHLRAYGTATAYHSSILPLFKEEAKERRRDTEKGTVYGL
jgi:hypothetical protein